MKRIERSKDENERNVMDKRKKRRFRKYKITMLI